MLDAFGASVLDDGARPEKGTLLDDGQVDAIDSELLEKLSLGFHAAPDLTALRSTFGLLGKRTSLSEVFEAVHVVWTPQVHRSTCWRRCCPTRDTPTTWCVTCFLFPALRWKPICHERCSLRLEAAYARRESGR